MVTLKDVAPARNGVSLSMYWYAPQTTYHTTYHTSGIIYHTTHATCYVPGINDRFALIGCRYLFLTFRLLHLQTVTLKDAAPARNGVSPRKYWYAPQTTYHTPHVILHQTTHATCHIPGINYRFALIGCRYLFLTYHILHLHKVTLKDVAPARHGVNVSAVHRKA